MAAFERIAFVMGDELLNLGIGKLGYGNMRLPKKDGKIDYEIISQMIDTFLKSGNSYFDTAYIYDEIWPYKLSNEIEWINILL